MAVLTKRFRWGALSLPVQFLLAGGGVMIAAMLIAGHLASSRIEHFVIQNTAASSAMLMESFVSPVSDEIASPDGLSSPARQALTEVFRKSALSQRVLSYRIWIAGNQISHDMGNHAQSGSTMTDDLARAWSGETVARFDHLSITDGIQGPPEPILTVFNPIRQAWTSNVIAVIEFQERAEALEEDMADARLTAWLVICSIFLVSGGLLFGIVAAGGRTIRQHKAALEAQLEEKQALLDSNEELRERVIQASLRASTENDKVMRQIGHELHDGPAQHMALAALRLDGALSGNPDSNDGPSVRKSIDRALLELRLISRGLAVPDLDRTPIIRLMTRLAQDHEKQSGMAVEVDFSPSSDLPLDYARKLCIYRFLQETLSNATRHAGVDTAWVSSWVEDDHLVVSVEDHGCGFQYSSEPAIRQEGGGQGLFSLRDRTEAIGGHVSYDTTLGEGSKFTLYLPVHDLKNKSAAA